MVLILFFPACIARKTFLRSSDLPRTRATFASWSWRLDLTSETPIDNVLSLLVLAGHFAHSCLRSRIHSRQLRGFLLWFRLILQSRVAFGGLLFRSVPLSHLA